MRRRLLRSYQILFLTAFVTLFTSLTVIAADKPAKNPMRKKAEGLTLDEKPAAKPSPSPSASPIPEPSPTPSLAPQTWNVYVGGSSDGQVVKIGRTSQVSLSGYSVLGRVSRSSPFPTNGPSFFKRMSWELGGGLEELKTTGKISSAVCKGSNDCMFTLASTTLFGRIGLVIAYRFDLQIRIGVDMLFPLSSSSNVIDYTPFQPLPFYTAGLFARYRLKSGRTVPIIFDYSTYFGNNDVALSRYLFSLGYSW